MRITAEARARGITPAKSDNVAQQKRPVAQDLPNKPDIARFISVDDVAMVDASKTITHAAIPVATAVSLIKGNVVSFSGPDKTEV